MEHLHIMGVGGEAARPPLEVPVLVDLVVVEPVVVMGLLGRMGMVVAGVVHYKR
jgi:hypothetical protein